MLVVGKEEEVEEEKEEEEDDGGGDGVAVAMVDAATAGILPLLLFIQFPCLFSFL